MYVCMAVWLVDIDIHIYNYLSCKRATLFNCKVYKAVSTSWKSITHCSWPFTWCYTLCSFHIIYSLNDQGVVVKLCHYEGSTPITNVISYIAHRPVWIQPSVYLLSILRWWPRTYGSVLFAYLILGMIVAITCAPHQLTWVMHDL